MDDVIWNVTTRRIHPKLIELFERIKSIDLKYIESYPASNIEIKKAGNVICRLFITYLYFNAMQTTVLEPQ